MATPGTAGTIATLPLGNQVEVRTRSLDIVVARCLRNARRIGRRLEKWLRANPEADPIGWVMWAANYEQQFVFSALKHQLERDKLKLPNAPTLTDAEYAAATRDLEEQLITQMPEERLRELLEKRK